ncbi:MAG: hypothetical protein ABFS41_13775, partial [Myxococcota bacterium]
MSPPTAPSERPLPLRREDAGASAAQRFRAQRIAHWDGVARSSEAPGWSAYYHRRLADVYRFLAPPSPRVLELGCGEGDLLAALGAEEA